MANRLRDEQIESPFSDDDIHDQHYFSHLRSKLRWQLLVTYVTPLVLLSAYFHYQYNQTLRQGIDTHLRSMAENKRNTVSLFLLERVSNTRSAFRFDALPRLDGEVKDLLSRLRRESTTFVDVGLFNGEGKLVSYAGPHADLRGKNYSKERWFLEVARAEERVFISDVFMGFRGRPHFIIAVRKTIRGQEWTLRTSVDPEKFADYVSRSIHMKNAEAFVINNDGKRQTSSRTGGVGETVTTARPQSKETPVDEVEDGGNSYLAACAWFSVVDWALVVRIPTSIALAPVRKARATMIGIMVLALVVVVALVLRRTSRIVGKLELADNSKVDLQRQLFNAAKLASVGEMAAGVAHEINNPLAIVYEEAGFMRDILDPQFGQAFDPDDFRERLDAIMGASIRGRSITRKLLAFARKDDAALELADINEVLDKALSIKATEFKVSNIEVKREYAQGLPRVPVNLNQMEQVLLNLLNNAKDAMDDGAGQITTRSRQEGKYICFDVEDTGCGISAEQLDKVFFPFFTTKGVGRGTGLGLSISYGIIKSVGGRIEVNSEQGVGTTFTVMLPIKSATYGELSRPDSGSQTTDSLK